MMPVKKTKDKAKTQPAAPAPTFEEALKRLEGIVEQLERAEAPLDRALELYEEGVGLARLCSEQLRAAERRVELLEDKNGTLRARPFSTRSTEATCPNEDEERGESWESDGDEDAEDEGEEDPTTEDEDAEERHSSRFDEGDQERLF